MTKPLEAYVAELQKVIDGPNGNYWSHGPAVSALIAALEQSQQNHRLHAARIIGEKALLKERIAELEARPVAPIDFKETTDADYCREWAWGEIKKSLTPENWSISDNATYYGFYLMGWDSRRQFNKQRSAEALRIFRAAGGTVQGDE